MKKNLIKSPYKGVKAFTLSAVLMVSLNASAETIDVQKFKYVGPYPVSTPWMVDTVNVKAEKFAMEKLLDSPLAFDRLAKTLGRKRERNCSAVCL